MWFCAALSISGAAVVFVPHESGGERRAWAYEIGVAFITSNNVEDFTNVRFRRDRGPAGGEVYQLTLARRLGEFHWKLGNSMYTPQLELPLSLRIVDENGRSPFLDYSASVVVRWVDFPWNEVVKTSFAMGLGLSYSEEIYLMDIQRHPNKYRSHLKFNWLIQLTFALPERPEHELMLFLSHHSWGRIFDRGGVNSLGFGYRRDF